MKRRTLLKTGLAVTAALMRTRHVRAEDSGARIYVSPMAGADSNSGAKDSPLRTLAAAARLVNASTDTGAITVILSDGVYAVNEPALFKPAGRSFTKAARLTIRETPCQTMQAGRHRACLC